MKMTFYVLMMIVEPPHVRWEIDKLDFVIGRGEVQANRFYLLMAKETFLEHKNVVSFCVVRINRRDDDVNCSSSFHS